MATMSLIEQFRADVDGLFASALDFRDGFNYSNNRSSNYYGMLWRNVGWKKVDEIMEKQVQILERYGYTEFDLSKEISKSSFLVIRSEYISWEFTDAFATPSRLFAFLSFTKYAKGNGDIEEHVKNRKDFAHEDGSYKMVSEKRFIRFYEWLGKLEFVRYISQLNGKTGFTVYISDFQHIDVFVDDLGRYVGYVW